MLAILIGLTIGIGLPLQTSINSRLRHSVGSPFLASLISFAVGTVFLAVMTLLIRHSLLFSTALLTQQPAWIWLGGLLGIVYLTGNILLFPKLGSVQTVIMPVLGQILAGLLIDNFGWFSSPVSHLSVSRVLGALLVLLGVLGVVALDGWLHRQHQQHLVVDHTEKNGQLWFWRLFGVVAGMLSAAQTAINGHLGQVLDSAVAAALVSFFVGTIGLLLIVLVLRPKWQLLKDGQQKNPWWMWIGGMIGGLYVLGNAFLVPQIGTGLAVVIVLVGLMSGSLLIDQFGWLESKRNPLSLAQLLGLVVMIAGVALIRLF
ncbi:DMT family transporter [Loigolactobacillus jiayinensis]|uniref:DMT family transporter n=1 Tax=Loigolactobacillus jiayinensis TaxID=2486016 RepID=A0ABW1RDW0_9LACO|nr:DMT family transporter [Loigolactobacillus jiayinensis]